ncbi:molybdenum cofactor cytidylyltransferase [Spirosomataceae bacterium TFI 002]|nr:molybdenum cofactor cytidylyltransferase [Spirosomataceae bacterium TFI 002]
MNLGIIILAAGSASRMGTPKQLLDIHGKSLLLRVIENCLDLKGHKVTVVLGANKALIKPTLEGLPINIVENDQWETGMSSSIKMGLVGSYMIDKNIDGVIVVAGDMPSVSELHLRSLLEKAQKTDKHIVASSYGDILGVPSLFKREILNELLDLEGDKGAAQVFQKHKAQIVHVPLGHSSVDIDTKEDYFNYLNSQN